MHYKSIVHELLQEQYPALHERLRKERALLPALDDYALALKASHETWMDRLSVKKPESDPALIANMALELAIEDLREEVLSSGSMPSVPAEEPFSLDAAMAHTRRALLP
jgi:hypothetical protein